MRILGHYPFYVFLLALFFCLHGVNENFGAITFEEAFETGFWVFLFLLILFALSFWLSKSKFFAGFFVFVIGLVYLFFGALKESVQHLPPLNSYKVLLPVLITQI